MGSTIVPSPPRSCLGCPDLTETYQWCKRVWQRRPIWVFLPSSLSTDALEQGTSSWCSGADRWRARQRRGVVRGLKGWGGQTGAAVFCCCEWAKGVGSRAQYICALCTRPDTLMYKFDKPLCTQTVAKFELKGPISWKIHLTNVL